MKKYAYIIAAVMLTASCATQKKVTDAGKVSTTVTSDDNTAVQKKNYIRKVTANAVCSQNIVSKIDFSINAMGKKASVDGKLQMRRDEVIRIVLSPFGIMEVGRLEFTPDYVLLIDRMHKEYVRASYNDLDFLRDNGLDFYSLQALFWNQLFLPNREKITDSNFDRFDVDLHSGATRKVSMKSRNLMFSWNTATESGRIDAARVEYGKGTSHASTASWEYGSFANFGNGLFPMSQILSFSSADLKGGALLYMTIKMKKLSSNGDWDAKTSVSSKYKEVKAEDILGKLTSM